MAARLRQPLPPVTPHLDLTSLEVLLLSLGAAGTGLLARTLRLSVPAAVCAGVFHALWLPQAATDREVAWALVPWTLTWAVGAGGRRAFGGGSVPGLLAGAGLAWADRGSAVFVLVAVLGLALRTPCAEEEEGAPAARPSRTSALVLLAGVALGAFGRRALAWSPPVPGADPAAPDFLLLGAVLALAGLVVWRARLRAAETEPSRSASLGVALAAAGVFVLLGRQLEDPASWVLPDRDLRFGPGPSTAQWLLCFTALAGGSARRAVSFLAVLAAVCLALRIPGLDFPRAAPGLASLDPASFAGGVACALGLLAAHALDAATRVERLSALAAVGLLLALALPARPHAPEASGVDAPDELFACTARPEPVHSARWTELAGWVHPELRATDVAVVARTNLDGTDRRYVLVTHAGEELAGDGAPPGALGFRTEPLETRRLEPGTWSFHVTLRRKEDGRTQRLGQRVVAVCEVVRPRVLPVTWGLWGLLALLAFLPASPRARWAWALLALLELLSVRLF